MSLDLLATCPNAVQDTLSLLSSKGTLQAHGQFAAHQDPQVHCCQTAFQQGGPLHVLVPGVVPPQVQDFTLQLFEFRKVAVSSLMKILNSIRPNTEPCGMPLVAGLQVNSFTSTGLQLESSAPLPLFT